MKTAEETAEEKAMEYADREIPIAYIDETQTIPISELRQAARIDYLEGYYEAMRWRDPKEELPNRDMQVVIKGGILKPEIGLDFENIHCTGYYCDGVWYVSPTDYSSIEIENPTGWRPIE